MTHHQMRFDLAHGVQQNADCDQNARAAEKLRHVGWNAHLPDRMIGIVAITIRKIAPASVMRLMDLCR